MSWRQTWKEKPKQRLQQPGRCGRCGSGDRTDQGVSAGSCDEHRTSVSGSDDHGCMSGLWSELYGYCNYEPEDTEDPEWREIYNKRCEEKGFSAYFDYSWQWAYREKFEKAGLTALLGCGFDPGVTQAYCAHAKKNEFDTIDTIDILDCNGGDHGYAFATNFNPEVNLREVSAPGSYWEDGHWVEIPAMSIKLSMILTVSDRKICICFI